MYITTDRLLQRKRVIVLAQLVELIARTYENKWFQTAYIQAHYIIINLQLVI